MKNIIYLLSMLLLIPFCSCSSEGDDELLTRSEENEKVTFGDSFGISELKGKSCVRIHLRPVDSEGNALLCSYVPTSKMNYRNIRIYEVQSDGSEKMFYVDLSRYLLSGAKAIPSHNSYGVSVFGENLSSDIRERHYGNRHWVFECAILNLYVKSDAKQAKYVIRWNEKDADVVELRMGWSSSDYGFYDYKPILSELYINGKLRWEESMKPEVIATEELFDVVH